MWNFKRSLGDMTGADSTEAMLLRVRDYIDSNYKKMSEQLRLFEEIKHDRMTEEQIIASRNTKRDGSFGRFSVCKRVHGVE